MPKKDKSSNKLSSVDKPGLYWFYKTHHATPKLKVIVQRGEKLIDKGTGLEVSAIVGRWVFIREHDAKEKDKWVLQEAGNTKTEDQSSSAN